MRSHHGFLATILAWLALPASLDAQGAGLVGSNGLEPEVAFTSVQVQTPSALEIRRLVPGIGSLIIAISPEPVQADLSAAGYPGAVLGVNLAPTSGPLVVLAGLDVPPSGTVSIPFVVPASLAGVSLYVQVINFDAAAPVGGAAISDAIVATFGGTNEFVFTSSGATAVSQDVHCSFTDGSQPGPVLPTLDGIRIEPLVLAATHDTVRLTADMPVLDGSDPDRPRVVLPGGTRLYRYSRPSGAQGLFFVRSQGRCFQWLFEVPGPIDPIMAASPFEPLVVVSIDGGAAQFGGAEMLLIRTDGQNHPGTASPVAPILLDPALAGFNLKNDSLTFLQGALLFTDSVQLVRLPTDLSAPGSVLPLPLSGGLPVIDVDRQFAWSRDGTTAALTAGQSALARDVYLVHPTGPAVNLTQASGEYDDVGYRDLLDGGSLALAPDASRAVFIRRLNGAKDVFLQDTTPGSAPVLLTGPTLFTNTIDQDVGIWMVAPSKVSFHAGSQGMDQDVYKYDLDPLTGQPVATTNVTGTSGVLTPPYNVGAILHGEQMGQLPGGGVAYVMGEGPGLPLRLSCVGTTTTVTQNLLALVGTGATPGGALVAVQQASGDAVLEIGSGGTPASIFTAAAGETLVGLVSSADGTHTLALTTAGTTPGASLVAPGMAPIAVSGLPGAALRAGGTFSANGSLIIGDAAGRLLRIDPLTGIATQLANPGGVVLGL